MEKEAGRASRGERGSGEEAVPRANAQRTEGSKADSVPKPRQVCTGQPGGRMGIGRGPHGTQR
eukprot:1579735-Rhodomonas_salina.1